MKKLLSLLAILGLAGFVIAPIYAQEEDAVALDEEPIVAEAEVVEDEDVATEEVAIDDELVDEEDFALEDSDEYTIEGSMDSDDWSMYFDDEDWGAASVDGLSLDREDISGEMVARILGLGFLAIIIGYCFFIYGSLLPISQWEIYRKAGKKAWAFLVPFWGTMVYSEIAGMSKWFGLLPWLTMICAYLPGVLPTGVYSVLMIILSIASLIWLIIANYRVARRYGWGKFASVLHALIIFCRITILVLGLGNYKYQEKKSEETIVEA